MSPQQCMPYNRALLPSLIAKDIKESAVYVANDKFFKDNQVNFIHQEAITRLSTKRHQISTESKTHVLYDQLLLTDVSTVRLPAIKGHHRKGVFDVLRLPSVKEIIKFIPFMDTAVIPVTSFIGFNTACALSRLGKEVIILTPPEGVLAEMFDDDTAALLKQIVESKNIRVISDTLEEILGDEEVKAVKLKSGKVIAAEMVLFDEASPDVRPLAETEIVEDNQVAVGEFFNTAVPDVFACDAALGAFDLLAEESRQQGVAAAANLLNVGSFNYQAPVLLRDFGVKVCDGFCGGHVRLLEGGREKMRFDGPSNIYKKVFLLNDALVGAVWFNATSDRSKVLDALIEKKVLAGMEEQFLQSDNPS